MDSDEPRLLTLDFDDSDDDEDLPDSGDDEPEMQDVQSETTATASAESAKVVADPSIPDTLRQLDDMDMSVKATKPYIDPRYSSEAAETGPDRPRFSIVVRDVAYSTYYAILYYVRPSSFE
jgi:hypothetical protein